MNRADTNGNGQPKIGVYVCHCGTNIAATVDVEAVRQFAEGLPGVAVARGYKYMCSDPGQELIKEDIKANGLDRVVVASCSPSLHETTFRRATSEGGLNPYFFQMVNIREQDAWVHIDMNEATFKAKDLIRAAVHRVRFHKPLERQRVDVTPAVMVVGGGIAGIHAALTMANAGKHVYLVEREPSIGGHMAQFDKTFPTLDCAACILTPKMTEVRSNPNITLWTMAEVDNVDGYVGNYTVTVRHKPRFIVEDACVGCLECIDACVYKVGKTPDEFNLGLSMRKPVYIPFPQAVPPLVVIDQEACIEFKSGRCKKTCVEVCADRNAIDFTQTETFDTVEVGAVILATGFKTFDPKRTPDVRLRSLPRGLHRPGAGAAGELVGSDRGARYLARRPDAEDGGDRPLHRQSRRQHQRVLLPCLLHVLPEAGAPGQGEDRGGDLQLLHRHPRGREGHGGVLQPGRRGGGPLHPGQGSATCTRRTVTPGG